MKTDAQDEPENVFPCFAWFPVPGMNAWRGEVGPFGWELERIDGGVIVEFEIGPPGAFRSEADAIEYIRDRLRETKRHLDKI